ncbi:MAG TPA: DNA-binding protein [Actinomycetota bacterium]|jgi:predicted transcriptional regulator|nr:DNA-binding protein [Actinomycetota bacterium]
MAGRVDPRAPSGSRREDSNARDQQTLTIRVPKEIHEALRTLAFATGTSINDIVLKGISDYLSSQGHRDAVEGFLRRAQEQYRVALDKLADL